MQQLDTTGIDKKSGMFGNNSEYAQERIIGYYLKTARNRACIGIPKEIFTAHLHMLRG
ncbi:hypothetical protein [Serratia oryzae]|uniref:hypothetical protein n=1 Tax=Serratia oryzae TaxID=2034155 RepID=UPI0012E3031A|nr:hypothetical protein [Serratia oryzae]